jgi:hypothetical protein
LIIPLLVHAKRLSETKTNTLVPVEVINRLLGLLGAHFPDPPPADSAEPRPAFQPVSTPALVQPDHLDAVSVDWQDVGMVWDDAFANTEELLSMFGLNAVDWSDQASWLSGT